MADTAQRQFADADNVKQTGGVAWLAVSFFFMSERNKRAHTHFFVR